MTTFSESTAADWDSSQAERGVHHEQPTGTDWAPADQVEKGYPSSDEGGNALEAYYPLDEDSGTTANDVSGNNRDGSTSGATVGATGILGTTAYTFDGQNDFVSVPDAVGSAIQSANALTVFCWAKPTDLSTDGAVVSNWNTTEGSLFMLWMDTGGSDGWAGAVNLVNAGGAITAGAGDATATADTFQSVAMTWDGDDLRIYVDGSETATNLNNNDTFTDTAGTGALGAFSADDNNRNFTGDIDEVRLYSRALSAAQVQALHDTGAGTSEYWADSKTS